MIRPTHVPVLAIIGCGCVAPSPIRRQVDAAEAVERQQQVETARLAFDLNGLLADFAAVDAEYGQASERFQLAEQMADHASPQFAMAERNYEAADQSYRWAVYVLVAAAAWDAGNAAAEKVCTGVESTRAYRRENDVPTGMCVDHIVPHHPWGVNHPMNYQVIPCSINSSLGDSVWPKFKTEPIAVIRGYAVSALAHWRCPDDQAAWRR